MSTPTKSQVYSINHIGEDGIIRCYCDEPAPLRTSRTNANPNRDFYACNKDREDPGRCKFWKWKDQLDALSQPPTPSQAQVVPNTPSQRQRADIARGSITSSPRKPGYSPSSAQMTPGSLKRLADIEAAVGRRTPSDTGRQQRMADIESAIGSTSQIYSPPQATTELDDDEDVFHSTVSSPPHSTHYHIHLPPPDMPRTPKRPRLEHDGSRNNNIFMTSPRSDGSELKGPSTDVPPESPSLGKRKEREGEESGVSQWQSIMRDQEHPYHERAASLRGAIQSASPQAVPSSQNTVVPSNLTPEAVKGLIDNVSHTLPSYFAKLERKQLATEKSNEAKVRRIEELESENAMLRNKARVLEETVSALKARRPPE